MAARLMFVAGMAVMLVVFAACGSSQSGATPTSIVTRTPVASATPTGTATATASPTPTPVVKDARSVTTMDDVPFPQDTNTLIVDGPWGKDGGPFDLRRVYRLGSGPVQQDTLYKPPDGSWITNVSATPDGRSIYVAVCAGIDCPYLGEPTGVVTTFYRSTDGGVTWVAQGTRDGRWGITALADGDAIATGDNGTEAIYVDLQSGTALSTVAAIDGLSMVAAGDQPGWWDRTSLVVRDLSGNSLLKPGGVDSAHLRGVELLLGGPGGGAVVTAFVQPIDNTTPSPGSFLFSYPRGVDGEPAVLSFTNGAPMLGGWLAGDQIVVTQAYERPGACTSSGMVPGAAPAVLDVKGATIAMIADPFLDDPCSHGGQYVAAVQTGVFVRVATSGDCLNLRTEARSNAASVRCLADGVLLTLTGQPISADGHEWLPVTAPDGTAGFVAAEFTTQD